MFDKSAIFLTSLGLSFNLALQSVFCSLRMNLATITNPGSPHSKCRISPSHVLSFNCVSTKISILYSRRWLEPSCTTHHQSIKSSRANIKLFGGWTTFWWTLKDQLLRIKRHYIDEKMLPAWEILYHGLLNRNFLLYSKLIQKAKVW